jgi:acetylornithine deacetylase/succinyl-diaminopimelate desuccinylase-like protein
MPPVPAPLAYLAASRSRFLAELEELIRFPTVSALPRHAGDLKRCALWLARQLRRSGLERVAVLSTAGHPLVFGEWLHAPGRPTVLVYGHYDVQPVDPLRAWRFAPFEPTVVGLDLYGRGASDDKGQLFAHVKALEAYLHSLRRLPVNVKCLFDGEEEVGSPHLARFVRSHGRLVAADVVLASDTRFLAKGRPAITYALRGALGLEVAVSGPRRDVHSGVYGGAVRNPAEALCEILGGFHGADGRIAIPGFYDAVRPVGERERARMATVAPKDAQILEDAMVARGWGEPGYSLYERTTIRPAVTVTGITAGHQGEGTKAVIPSKATARIDIRLVPDQDPREVECLLRRYVVRVTPPATRVAIRTVLSSRPVTVDRSHPALLAAAAAYRRGFGVGPVLLRLGGSIPAVGILQERVGAPAVLMGFGLPDDGIHAPNERFHLPNFYNGIATSIWFLAEVARRVGSSRGTRLVRLRSVLS